MTVQNEFFQFCRPKDQASSSSLLPTQSTVIPWQDDDPDPLILHELTPLGTAT